MSGQGRLSELSRRQQASGRAVGIGGGVLVDLFEDLLRFHHTIPPCLQSRMSWICNFDE